MGKNIVILKHSFCFKCFFFLLHALYVHTAHTHTQQLCLPTHTYTIYIFLRSVSLLRDFFIVRFVRVERSRIFCAICHLSHLNFKTCPIFFHFQIAIFFTFIGCNWTTFIDNDRIEYFE